MAKINEIVAEVVRREPAFDKYREGLEDEARMQAYPRLREQIFVPIRPLEAYLDAFPCCWTYITARRSA